MAKHLDAIRKNLNGAKIRAAGEAMGLAVVVTEDEIVTGKAKLFGAKLERFKLAEVRAVRVVPNPSANLLEIGLGGHSARSLTVMYGPEALKDFEDVIGLLRQQLHGAGR
jgi:hypothetical protein